MGALLHKSLGMTDADVTRVASRLTAGHAAVGALVAGYQVDAFSEQLSALGGELEVHEVSPRTAEIPVGAVQPRA